MKVKITPVETEKDKRAFYHFAWQVYKDDPYWVPHLWPQRKQYLDKKAAFFSYGEGEYWMAKQDGKVVGTIGTAINYSLNQDKKINTTIFGFFEVLPNGWEVAKTMWDHASEWTHKKGLNELRGPYSFSGNDENGFLVEGNNCLPSIMMGHHPLYYGEFAEKYGFKPIQESIAYRFDLSKINYDVKNGPEIFHRIAARARERHGETVIRNPRMDNWEQEIELLHPVYNKSLAVLPEFTPIELAEFRSQANSLRDVIDPELVFIAEIDGKAVGFVLGLPNITEALRYAHGLRYPWDYLRFLIAKKRITSASFKILAVDPDFWGYGLEAAMIVDIGKAVIHKGYTWVDGSLTNELNPQTNKFAQRLGARIYRRYREYSLKI